MSCRVTIAQGTLGGKVCTTYEGRKYYSFEGIPYAKPPIGRLRFRDPQEPDSWSGVRDATKPGNKCTQMNPTNPTSLIGSEDCLYLNVYTPSLPSEKLEKLPVLFFVHGGRFLVGYGDYYRPDYLIRHDVILVTLNYRLGIFGFLCLNTPEVPGNAGLKDTIMALKWVKNNIQKFNGDENNVTAMGESAGAGMVTSYLTSPMADGLCNKIISQSGNAISDLYMVDEDPVERARVITKFMGNELSDPKAIYEYLSNASLDEMAMGLMGAEISRPPAIINSFLLPVVEKAFDGVDNFFTETPMISIREGRCKNLPIIITINSHEGAPFLRQEAGGILYEDNLQYFIPRYLSIKHDTPKALDFAKRLRNHYFDGNGVNDKKKYLDFVSDAYFSRDTVMFIESLSRSNASVYFAYFSYVGNMNTSLMRKLQLEGATHGDLIQYLFYRENKHAKCDGKDRWMTDFLSEAWCNFAKNGVPTWTNQPVEWSPYERSKKLTLHISKDLQLVPNPNWDRYTVWTDAMGEKCKL